MTPQMVYITPLTPPTGNPVCAHGASSFFLRPVSSAGKTSMGKDIIQFLFLLPKDYMYLRICPHNNVMECSVIYICFPRFWFIN